MTLSPAVFEIISPKHVGVTTLTFQGHVTSMGMWPFDTPGAISYRCSTVTEYLQPFSWYYAPNVSRSHSAQMFSICAKCHYYLLRGQGQLSVQGHLLCALHDPATRQDKDKYQTSRYRSMSSYLGRVIVVAAFGPSQIILYGCIISVCNCCAPW